MTQTVLTVDKAPRAIEDLARVGKYQLGRLAEQMGMMETDRGKVDWSTADDAARVQIVHQLLRDHDGGAARAESKLTRPVASQSAPYGGPTVPSLRPDALAAARAATAAPAPARPAKVAAVVEPEIVVTVQRLLEEMRGLVEQANARFNAHGYADEGVSHRLESIETALHELTRQTAAIGEVVAEVRGVALLLATRGLKLEPGVALQEARAGVAELCGASAPPRRASRKRS